MTMRRLRLSASRRFGAGGAPPIATPAAARRRSFLAADVRLVAGGVWAILRDAGRKFYADDCATLAAAISFYALLSLIPVYRAQRLTREPVPGRTPGDCSAADT